MRFQNFERWDFGNLDASVPKKTDMLQFEYARSALRNGLKLESELGTNPYKFGMIGSTDAHTSLATAAENNFWGKAVGVEPGRPRTDITFIASSKVHGATLGRKPPSTMTSGLNVSTT